MSSMVYRFKEAAHLPSGLDPQRVGERLAKIKESEGSGFTPETVVKDARRESSPLHKAFTWDDGEAAEKYRVQEAGYLIRNIVVVYGTKDDQREQRAFVPVTVRDADEGRYLSIVDVVADPEYRRQHINRLLGELVAIRRKGKEFEEFARIWAAIDSTVEQLSLAA